MLSRDEIAQAARGPIKIIDVPEWGGAIGCRRLSGAELVELRQAAKEMPEDSPEANLAAVCRLLSLGLCDADGKAMFSTEDIRDWDGQQISVMQQLLAAVEEHNGMGAGAAEDREKNSESGQTSDST